MSRVTTAHLYKTPEGHIAAAREREMVSAEKAMSTKEIVKPSQDPTGWSTAQRLRDHLASHETIGKNGSLAAQILNTTETALSHVQDAVQTAHSIAIQGSTDSTETVGTHRILLNELKTVFDGAVRSMNTRYAGKTLFGGFQTQKPAFSAEGKYQGDSGIWKVEVGKDLEVPLNLTGAEVFLGEGRSNGIDIVSTMQRLMRGLEQNDVEAVRSTLNDLLGGIDQLSAARGQLGARVTEVERSLRHEGEQKINMLSDISKVEEADPVKAFADLARDQSVLKAAMATTQKILSEDASQLFFK